uniref:Candidate secreted effector n=1 Tax=Meloidogyne incognita TaxID=6306 RepID=A0A914LGE9_MELIC
MLKFLILICLIIKTHSWTWKDYPSPRGTTYWKCGLTKPAWVCDPDGMLNDQERKKIVELPRSKFICAREGLRLVVALAKVKIGLGNGSSGLTVCQLARTETQKIERAEAFHFEILEKMHRKSARIENGNPIPYYIPRITWDLIQHSILFYRICV